MAQQVSKNIQALAEAAEEKRRQQEQGFDPSVAGLGLGGGVVASQIGGQASTSSKLSPFAQQVAAADTARLNPPINAPKSNPILGRNVPTNPLNPSVGPMTKQPSLTAAQEAASRAAEETARRGPSSMAKISQFVDNALSGASKFARAVNIPSLLLTPNSMGDSTLTGNNIILSPFEQMATDNYRASMAAGESAQQYQEMIEQGGLMDPPSAAEAGDNLINIGNSLFPNEAPVGLMTPELRDQTPEVQGQSKNGFLNGFFKPEGFGYEYLGPRLGENIGNFLGSQKYGTGLSADGEVTGRPISPNTLPAQTATLGATILEFLGDATQGAKTTMGLAGQGAEYLTGLNLVEGGPVAARPTEAPVSGKSTMTGTEQAPQPEATDMAQLENLSPAQQNFLARKEKGTPLEPWEILDAQKYAVSQGQIFDPETGYSQAEFYGQRYKGQSIGDYLRGADTQGGATEQFVDPQGRLRRSPEYSSYERESAAREARLEARPDFMKARPSQARKDGVMSMAQAVKVAGGDRKKAAAMIELQKMGRDPLTGQPEKPEGMDEYQTETIRQNQERIDLAKDQAEAAKKAAEAAGATQAEKDAYDIAQKKVNLATTYQKLLDDQETQVFDAKDIEADLDSISDQLDIIYDPESGVFRRGKIWGEGEVIKIDDPKNASIVRTIGTYKVGKALLDKYPKKG
jgi:hypothetical protein